MSDDRLSRPRGAPTPEEGSVESDAEFRSAVTALKESNSAGLNHLNGHNIANDLRSRRAACYSYF